MAEKKKLDKKSRKSLGWEIFWLTLFGIIALAGLVIGILGVCAHNVGWLSRNALYAAETAMTNWLNFGFRVDWRAFGAILLIIGMLGIVIALYYFANKYDKEALKASRRAERLKAILSEQSSLIDSSAVVPGFINADEATTRHPGQH